MFQWHAMAQGELCGTPKPSPHCAPDLDTAACTRLWITAATASSMPAPIQVGLMMNIPFCLVSCLSHYCHANSQLKTITFPEAV